jgi:hypothetical protein
MNYEEEINQLRKQIQNVISKEGFSTLLSILAQQALATLQRNESHDLNSLDYAVLKLMMIDYLSNSFNKNSQ